MRDVYAEQAGQQKLFDVAPDWQATWQGMPAFEQHDQMPCRSLKVHFRTEADCLAFASLLGQTITAQTKFVWFPQARLPQRTAYVGESTAPRYPIYVISKGRWESRLTSKAFEKLCVQYHIVIEPQEYDQYAAVIDPSKILTLPFSNLGQGSIPARNWVWEHALSTGARRHWIVDDNIDSFYRVHNNDKRPIETGVFFCAIEDFVDRYSNIALAGPNYRAFAKRRQKIPPFYLNTRIYSCILIDNALTHRWRGRYNEDTDLSLRVLKDGLCTALFNAFVAGKTPTMTIAGGNTDELYQDDGRLKMAQSLQEQHPDVVTITQKWGRPQHQVNYKVFQRNKLLLKPDVVLSCRPNDYGMLLTVKES